MTVLMSAAVAIVAILGFAVTSIGALYAARAQAQTASDAAALAAAVATYPPTGTPNPTVVARDFASRNDAGLVSCRCPRDPTLSPRTVTVVTSVRADVPIFGVLMVRASSRAEFDPGAWFGR